MKHKLIGLLLISLLITGFTVWAQEYLIIKDKEVKLRTEPEGLVITTLPQKSKLKVVNQVGNWIKVKGKVEVEGWIPENTTSSATNKESIATRIDGGFICNKINFINSNGLIKVTGSMTNQSGEGYHIATFIVTVYNEAGEQFGKGYINIGNFAKQETERFSSILSGRFEKVGSYQIRLQEK
ncbi:hypothetical protein Halha_0636 [Halobacteroides halobius DSM 5150]|uniref:SH3 domain-containing protein n=1 Tax=Halobacteroides halobius (strain ATCC 35273 / DSM 5150 / MD-1) TaxID=748449 RepID=L0K8B8_HALHC|nr:FxLYD domain-containing protein [Halobacteroides halobius]AGB40609.1 hypothetical protein Halha_0636 [Halobacteroides halobius DSM 5150]